MDVLLSAVASDLTGRLVSFLIRRYQAPTDDGAVRLQRALLRARAVVEDAEGRQIGNRAMLQQLRRLRRELCRGVYVLDDLVDPRWKISHANRPAPGTSGGSSSSSDVVGAAAESLEAALSDMAEFVVLLGGYPRVAIKQPYSAYLFMECCMFGRQLEKEHVISFLLQPSHQDLDVLPIIGAHDVGKRTLVEHVSLDERIRARFTEVRRLSGDDLLGLLPMSSGDHGEQHRRSTDDASTVRSSLFVVDLAGDDADKEDAWRKFLRRRAGRGCGGSSSKVIIISTTERHSHLGTVPPLRLLAPRREELWYLFKGLAFGGADPEDCPELVRVAMAIFSDIIDLSPYTTVHNVAASLRADMNARAWRRVLHVSSATTVLPLQPPGDGPHRRTPEFCFLSRPVKGAAGTPFLFYDRRKLTTTGLARDELPKVAMLDLVTGSAAVPVGETRFDVLVWQSRIPPYPSYVLACDLERAREAVAGQTRRVRLSKRKQDDDGSKAVACHDQSRRTMSGSRPSA